jgi:hypothetical protein
MPPAGLRYCHSTNISCRLAVWWVIQGVHHWSLPARHSLPARVLTPVACMCVVASHCALWCGIGVLCELAGCTSGSCAWHVQVCCCAGVRGNPSPCSSARMSASASFMPVLSMVCAVPVGVQGPIPATNRLAGSGPIANPTTMPAGTSSCCIRPR